MKIIITALLLLAGIAGKGQTINLPRTHFLGRDLPLVDTQKVWFQVTDTSTKYRIDLGITFKGELVRDTVGSWQDLNIHVIPGYIAYQKIGNEWNDFFYMHPVANLNEHKGPLSSNLIIWQSQNR